MAIGGYSINGYWWMGILLMASVNILLMAICGYSINGYWLLNYK
jgi:hypothetical protein